MAHRLLQDPESSGWERSDFPIVCETCLGPNPYVRMQKVLFDALSRIALAEAPYSLYRALTGGEAADPIWR